MAHTARFRGHLEPLRRYRVWLRALLAFVVLALAGFLIHRTIGQYSGEDVLASVVAIPTYRLILAGFFAAASYVCLTGFDALAVRYVGRRIPYRYIAMTSFASLSLGHNIGFAALSSGAIRYRLYSRYGLAAGDVARIIVFCGITVGLGLTVLGGLAFCWRPGLAEQITGISRVGAIVTGGACLAAAGGYLVLCATWRRSFTLWRWRFRLPSLRLALCQLAIGPLNFVFVAACLHQAIVGVTDVPYAGVASVYVMANVATLISHVPGGLGVIESVVLLLLPGTSMLGALIVFRVVYFLIPLVLGSMLLALTELCQPSAKGPPVKAAPPAAGMR